MRELYLNVSQHFRAGKLAEGLRRHSQKLRAVVIAMAMIFIAAPFYGQSWNLVTDASDLEVGDSVIIVSGNYALGTTQNTSNRAAVAITNNGDDVEFTDEAGVQGIKLVEGTVDNTFGFFVGNGYLYASSSSSNQLKTQDDLDDNGSWVVTISEGVTSVVAQGTNTRNNIRYNPNNGNPIFSCYSATSTQQTVSIYKYEEGGPSISLTQSLVDFSYNINNGPSAAQSFSVEGSNLTADITVSVPDDADFELCSTEDGTYTSSVTITPSEGTVASTDVFVRMKAGLDAGAYNATVTIASTGATSKTISLTGSVVDPDAVYYTVVTEAPATDWTGEYLITYTNGNVVKALAGSSGTSTNYGTEEDVSEYLVGNKITANATTDGIKVTAQATDGGYSLYLENVGYLGWSSGKSLIFDENVTEGRNEWSISISDGTISIDNVGESSRTLRYNASSPRFACYTGGQAAITLYKSPREVIATPVFTPATGYYSEAQNVTITCATEGATIYYTTDGTAPTNESIQYTGPIAVSQSTTIKAIAYVGDRYSNVATATYTLPVTAANIAELYALVGTEGNITLTGDVTFVYRNVKNIFVKDATGGLLVFDQNSIITTVYTEGDVISGGISGTISMYHGMFEFVPTANTAASTQNTGAVAPTVITVEQLRTNNYVSQLVKVENVAVATGTTYTTGENGSNVTFSQNGNEALLRNSFKTLDMTIEDNTNWNITGFAAIYDDNIQLYPRGNEDVTEFVLVVPAEPTFSAETGTYYNDFELTLACETEGATIYYTLDGSDPTDASNEYTAAIAITATTTVKAIAILDGVQSEIVSETYTMATANPVFSQASGTYTGSVDVAITCETQGATIYYTLNDTDTEEEYNPENPFTFIVNTTIYAFAEKNSVRSETVSATYTITDLPVVETPTIEPNVRDFVDSVEVTLACATEDATIYYTTDGNDPTIAEENLYSEPFTLYETKTVKAIAVKDGMANSNIAETTFTKLIPVATPTINPNGGEFVNTVEVTLACETEEATIYYTTDESVPTAESASYTSPFTLTESATVKAIAVKAGMANSAVAEAIFTKLEQVATPTITPNGGTFETSVEVTLTCATEEAAIYYTTNGNEPTVTEGTLYDNNPFSLTESVIVKAIAVKEGMATSEIAEATFTKQAPALVFTKIDSHNLITTDDIYMIVDVYSKKALTSENGSSSAPTAVDVTIENDTITGNIPNVLMWKFAEVEGGYSIYPVDNNEVWLYSTNSNNGVRVGTNANKAWILDITADTVPTYHGMKNYATSRYLGVYSEQDWRTYTSIHDNIRDTQIEFFVLGNAASVVATPTFSVPAGTYTTAQTVEIHCATEGATIRYTLDGTDPTEESTEYTTEALTISEPTTVKAKAFKEDYIASAVAEAFYNVITTPTIIVDAETLNFENTNETKTLNVSSFNLTENITVAVTENFTVDAETITMNTEATLTVTFTGSAATEGTLTLTSGETVKTVALVASPLVVSDGCYYPVAEALTDWTGDYIITYTDLTGETINALNDISEDNIGTYENVFQYYADGVIASNITTELCKVTVEQTANGYSMYLNRTGYLGYNGSGNKLYSNNEFGEDNEWTFSENNGEITITNVHHANRVLKWNNSSPRFACYDNATRSFITLYKLGAISTVATPVFTPAAGYYEAAQNVTITCATEGATIYYTTDGTTPTNASTQYTAPIAVSQNTTIKAIAYVGEEFSFVATARYTFPNFVENIAALYEVENTTETYVLSGDVTFVFRNGKNIYVKDATGGLLIFDQSNVVTTEYTEGDVISGGITGTISMYHGMLEFVPSFNTAASTQNTGAVAPTVITVEQLLTNNYVSQLVKVENVAVATGTTYTAGETGSNVTFSQNGNEAILRNGFKTLNMEIGDNTNWDIIGFAAIYDENIQIYPRNNDDVTIVTSVEDLASEIAIYPNPTSDIVNIVTNGNAQRVEITNVDGQIVSNETVSSDVVTISLEAQPAGMYFVRIYTANEVIVRKVTKF